jgi:PAS domain S-box-containing protein
VADPLGTYQQLAELLDSAPAVLFCLKDVEGRYLAVNHAFVERTSVRTRREVIGRSAAELFPAELARRYEQQDRELLADGQPVRDELELITGPDGQPGWYVTTKLPVLDDAGVLVAIAVVSVDLGRDEDGGADIVGLQRAVQHVHQSLDASPSVEELAAVAGLTVAQLERRMHRVFGLSPKQYVMKARVEEANRLLATTDRPLAEIAQACGWYDQSAFTRQFTRVVGSPPGEYRARNRSPR